MAGVSDADLAAAVVIAVVLILVALAAWPGLARVRPRTLAGYWVSRATGAMHEVRPGRGRAFVVATPAGPAAGTVRGLRRVRIAAPGGGGTRAGTVELGNRQIFWEDGDLWALQGIQ